MGTGMGTGTGMEKYIPRYLRLRSIKEAEEEGKAQCGRIKNIMHDICEVSLSTNIHSSSYKYNNNKYTHTTTDTIHEYIYKQINRTKKRRSILLQPSTYPVSTITISTQLNSTQPQHLSSPLLSSLLFSPGT